MNQLKAWLMWRFRRVLDLLVVYMMLPAAVVFLNILNSFHGVVWCSFLYMIGHIPKVIVQLKR